MKLFDPEHPFTRSVSHSIRAMGGFDHPVSRNSECEQISFGWFAEVKHDLLYHDPENDIWEGWGKSGDHENLMLNFASDGWTFIRQGDDDECIYLETTLRAGDEIQELMEFYENSKADSIGTSGAVTKSLKSLLNDVYILIPGEKAPTLLPTKGIDFQREYPGIAKMLNAHLVSENPEDLMEVNYWCIGSYIDDHGLRDKLPQCQPLLEGDILINDFSDPIYAGIFKQDGHSHLGSSPTLVIRIRPDVSRMWMSDYLQFSQENGNILEQLVKNWKDLGSWMSKVQVKIPSSKRDQVASSISRRYVRYRYQNRVKRLATIREPFEQIIPLYRKRIRAVDALHTELLDDLEAIQQPLPFFIEYPYRHFRKEDDHIQKIRAGQRLLGVLAKVPLYLVTEELLALGHPLGSEVLLKLEERAPSEGTLVGLQKFVAKELSVLPRSPLNLFSGLQNMMLNTPELDAMVTARNRMHHEPFDEDGFLDAVSKHAPKVIEGLRTALQSCRFIVPHHGKVVNGEKVITAEDASNSDAHFRMIELKVSLPLEEFPSDELIVWKSEPERAMKLGKLLNSKVVSRQSRDFGIFDRVQRNERHFTFVRSD